MATKYKGSVKLPAGLGKMGDGDYKLIDANDVNICSKATKDNDTSLTTVIDDIYNTLHSQPTLSYVDEPGFGPDQIKYWNLGEEMYIKFKAAIPSGAMTLTVYRNGVSIWSQNRAGSVTETVSVGTATKDGTIHYQVTAVSTFGEEADRILSFTQTVGNLQIITDDFDSKTIRESGHGSKNDLAIPFEVKFADRVNKFVVNATITDPDGIEVLRPTPKEASGTASYSDSFIIHNLELLKEGTYNILLKAEATLANGDITRTESILTFPAIEDNTLAVFFKDTNMINTVASTQTLFITYLVDTNIELFKATSVLSATVYIYDADTDELIQTYRKSNITAGGIYTQSSIRLKGGIDTHAIRHYRYVVEATHNTATEGYNKKVLDGVVAVENDDSDMAPTTTGLLFEFNASTLDTDRQTTNMWYSTLYEPAKEEKQTYYMVKLSNINNVTTGFIADDRGDDWGNMLQLKGNSYGEIWYHKYETGEGGVGTYTEGLFCPFENIVSKGADEKPRSFSFEILMNTTNLGVADASALICGELDKARSIYHKLGFKVNYSDIKFTASTICSTAFADNNWAHIVFVLDQDIRQMNEGTATNPNDTSVEDYNPIKTLNIYVNGVKVAFVPLADVDIADDDTHGIYLNCAYNYDVDPAKSGLTAQGGECRIKLIRCYNKGLTASEVLANYYNAVSYNSAFAKAEQAKNDLTKTQIPILYMIRNSYGYLSDGTPIYSDTNELNTDVSSPYYYEKPPKESRFDPKAPAETRFGYLNHITDKTESKATRVNCTVWYTYYENETTKVTKKWDDVDVFLQGTSSLAYPVKNYKFKIYKQKEYGTGENAYISRVYKLSSGEIKPDKQKVIPFSKTNAEGKGIDGWYTKDNTFTLKCDYMEQSHRNNTPTAMFYEKVLDKVVSATGSHDANTYTIAKDLATMKDSKITDPVTQNEVKVYRDAIEGFPVLLYYDENDEKNQNHNIIAEGSEFIPPSTAQYVGSYMFNTDKSSNSMGFEITVSGAESAISIKDDSHRFEKVDGHFVYPGLKYINGKYYVKDVTWDGLDPDKEIIKDINGNDLSINCLPCTSLEGRSNANGGSASTFYTLHEANNEAYSTYTNRKYYTAITKAMDDLSNTGCQSYAVQENSYLYLMWNDFYKTQYENIDSFVAAVENEEIENILTKEQFKKKAKKGTLSIDDEDGDAIPISIFNQLSAESIKVYTYINGWEDKEETSYYNAKYTDTSGDFYNLSIISHDNYEYIKRTFEGRWLYSEEAKLSGKIQRAKETDIKDILDYGPILNTLTWFESVANESTEDKRKKKFRNEFKNHFSYPYTMAYYLQMMVFMQVDNAGKNAMFDQWGDGIWYIRPYDMDTQVGLDNSGLNIISVGAEYNPELSPTAVHKAVDVSWSTQKGWDTDKRVTGMYNTQNSRLWQYFGKYYKDEIEQIYAALRDTAKDTCIYTADQIIKFVESYTTDIIGQTFYNRDGSIKYLTQIDEEGKISYEDRSRLLGSRDFAYKQIITDRITFLDSYFDTSKLGKTKTKFNTLSVRSAASAGDTSVVVPIVISVYSPTYIKCVAGTSGGAEFYVYVDPSDEFIDPYRPDAKPIPGVCFYITLSGGNKEMSLYGIESIRDIYNLEGLKLTTFDASTGILKMASINLSRSAGLAGFNPGASKYLRTLDLSNCSDLGTGDDTVDASQCANLETINVENTKISHVNLPENSLLSYINVSNTYVTSLSLNGLSFLTIDNLHYDNCYAMETIHINNCGRITSLDLSGLSEIKTLEAINCENLDNLIVRNSKLSTLNLAGSGNIKTIDFSSNKNLTASADPDLVGYFVMDLSSQMNLTSINIRESGTTNSKILLILPKSLPLISNFNAYKSSLTAITNFDDLQNAKSVKAEHPEVLEKLRKTLDFNAFGLGVSLDEADRNKNFTLNLQYNYYSEYIKNLKYRGSCASLFYSSYDNTSGSNSYSKIKGFENCVLQPTGDSIQNMFYCLGYLKDLSGIDFVYYNYNPNKAINYDTSAGSNYNPYTCVNIIYGSSCLYGTQSISASEIKDGKEVGVKKLLKAIPMVQTLASFWDLSDNARPGKGSRARPVPSNLFEYNHRITTLSGAFCHHNNLPEVGSGLFAPIKYIGIKDGKQQVIYPLTSLSSLFSWSSALPNGLPYDFFMKDEEDYSCIHVNTWEQMFYSNGSFTGFKNGNNYTLNINYPVSRIVREVISYRTNAETGDVYDIVYGDVIRTKVDPDTGETVPDPEFNSLTNMSTAFEGCFALRRPTNENETDNIKVFLSKFPKLQKLVGTFCQSYYGSKSTSSNFITYIPEKLFENNLNLTDISRAFAGIGSLVKLPERLFGDGAYKNLTKAPSLFACCGNLKGWANAEDPNPRYIAAYTLFLMPGNGAGSASKITDIGSSKFGHGSNSVYRLPGIFGNTAIQGFDRNLLQCLPQVTKLDMLFYQGERADSSITPNYRIKATNDLKYIRYTEESSYEINSDGLIPNDFFKYCGSNVGFTNVSYVFAGNNSLTGFGEICNDPDDPNYGKYIRIADTSLLSLFTPHTKANTLAYARGLFAFTGLACQLPNNLFTDCPKLIAVDSCFAGCTNLSGKINYDTINSGDQQIPVKENTPPLFRGCTALTTTRKFLYKCKNVGSPDSLVTSEAVPKNLFNSCRETLTDVAGMFFGCTSLTGIFEKTTPDIIVEGTYTTQETIQKKNSETGLIEISQYDIQIILGQPHEGVQIYTGDCTFKYKNTADVEWQTETTTYTIGTNDYLYKNKFSFDATDLFKNSSTTYTISLAYVKGNFKLTKLANQLEPGESDIFNNITKNGAKFSIVRKGLLSDCTNLIDASNLFAGCTGLYGAVPEDLFFSSTSAKYESLIDISGLFKYCKNLSYTKAGQTNTTYTYQLGDTSSETKYLFPTDWLSSCPAITDISYIFMFNACAAPEDTGANNTTVLDTGSTPTGWNRTNLLIPNNNPFNSSVIAHADYAFTGMRVLADTNLDYQFFPLGTYIESTIGMFQYSNLKSAGTNTNNAVFGENRKPTSIKNMSRMFYTGYKTFSNDAIFCAPSSFSNVTATGFFSNFEVEGRTNTYYTNIVANYPEWILSSTTPPALNQSIDNKTYAALITNHTYDEYIEFN